jgi:electron transfer flavoprotein alpha subunit
MSGILVVTEQTAGVWNRMSFETLAGGQQLSRTLCKPVCAVVFGQGTGALAAELAGYRLDRVIALDHDLLGSYTADAATGALSWLIARWQPEIVLFPHTYRVRDFAPCLAARAGQPLLSDVIGFRVEDGSLVFQRLLFQGKLNADYAASGQGTIFASLQAGAFRADALEKGEAPVETLTPPLDAASIRQQPEAPFRESARAVDLGAAELIVAVGRGIHEEGNLALVEELAEVLGAELAASRPICDNGWLPMERRHLRRHSAPGRHEGFSSDCRHQQRRRSAHLRGGRLRHCRRSVRRSARANRAGPQSQSVGGGRVPLSSLRLRP